VTELEQPVTAVAASADGEKIAIGTMDGSMLILETGNTNSRKVLRSSPESVDEGRSIQEVKFSRDGSRVFWADYNHYVHSKNLNPPEGAWCSRMPSECNNVVEASEGDALIVGGKFEGVRFLATRDGRLMPNNLKLPSLVTLCCRQQGNIFASGHYDGTIRIRCKDCSVNELVLRIHPEAVKTLCLSENSGFAVSADAELNLGIWNAISGDVYGLLPNRPNTARSEISSRPVTLMSDDQRWLVTLTLTGFRQTQIVVYDLLSNDESPGISVARSSSASR
jgi:WD40 repeat protein